MVLDIFAAVVLLVTALFFMRKGFALSIMAILEWFAAASLSLFFCKSLSTLLIKSGIGKSVKAIIAKQVDSTTPLDAPNGSVQALFNGWISDNSAYVAHVTAGGLNQIFFAIVSFVALALIVKILLWLVLKFIFKRDKNTGLVAFLDTLGGFTVGFLVGVFFVLVLLLILMAAFIVMPESLGVTFQKLLEESSFTGSLYEHNFFITLLHNLLI